MVDAGADPHLRERARMALNEPYRTLLGHFRHEAGHYYWNRLVTGERRPAFRAVFGDERAPYQESLDAYYRLGPPADWQRRYVGAYASCHPLEDFAECWAHYLHMADALQTAAHAGVLAAGRRPVDLLDDGRPCFEQAVADWRCLATSMNEMNRSLGLPDAYPFALPAPVVDKLRYVHELVRAWHLRHQVFVFSLGAVEPVCLQRIVEEEQFAAGEVDSGRSRIGLLAASDLRKGTGAKVLDEGSRRLHFPWMVLGRT